MAARFTTAELAALKIVADEIRAKGTCGLVLDAIAARAGVSKRSVQNALREAEALGYLTIRRRRLPGQLKNLPNLVSIIAIEWLSWLKVAKPYMPRVKPKIPTLRNLGHEQIRDFQINESRRSQPVSDHRDQRDIRWAS
jgi:DNA-binding transcriptional MocR family regulator